MDTRTYDDASLTAAVAASQSWRGVLRRLGLKATSAGAARSVRRHAERLGLDHGHFTGQRRWTDADLAAAVAVSLTWTEVVRRLGLDGGSSAAAVKGHARRLGLDTSHVSRPALGPPGGPSLRPDPVHLPRAGASLAAAYLTLCGGEVSWPLEPCAYDLVVRTPDATVLRVQVKTTRTTTVSLTTGGRAPAPYDPDAIDHFFVVDARLRSYFVPVAAVAGRTAASLATLHRYLLPSLVPEPEPGLPDGPPVTSCGAPGAAG